MIQNQSYPAESQRNMRVLGWILDLSGGIAALTGLALLWAGREGVLLLLVGSAHLIGARAVHRMRRTERRSFEEKGVRRTLLEEAGFLVTAKRLIRKGCWILFALAGANLALAGREIWIGGDGFRNFSTGIYLVCLAFVLQITSARAIRSHQQKIDRSSEQNLI